MKQSDIDPLQGRLQEKLERGIIEKLKYEWETIYQDLELRNRDLAQRISPPSIVLTNMKACLGQWIQEFMEIRLSRELVMNGRWDSVCEVLRHETAHQLASSFSEYKNQSSHGELFIECCKAINANPEASGSYQTLEQRIFGSANNSNDKIITKVKKLMSLASSGNKHEAEAAAAKAREFIYKYNIDIIKHDKKRHFESIIITEPVLKRSQAELLTSAILQSFYFVRPIWLSTYIPEKNKIGSVLEITGTLTNIKIADYVFHYVLKYAEKCWLEYKADHPRCRSRSGYMTGIVNGFREKLQEKHFYNIKKGTKSSLKEYNNGNSHNNCSAHGKKLAIIEDKQLAKYFQYRYPSLVKSKAHYRSASISAYKSGKDKGRQLVISQGISSHEGNLGKLIGS